MRFSKQNIRACLLFAAFLVVSLQAGSAENAKREYTPPEPTSPPEGRQLIQIKITEELDAGESVAIVNEDVAHPSANSAEIVGDVAIVVTREELAAMQGVAELGSGSEPQVHIQGEFDPAEQHGDESGLAAEENTTALDTSEVPYDPESGVQSSAQGVIAKEFDGIANSGSLPPDTEMAIGKDYIVEATNSGFEIRNLRGDSLQSYTAFSNFFNNALPSGWNGSLFDPRVIYNQNKQQFLMLVVGKDTGAQNSQWFLAISKTSDPTGDWWLYANEANIFNTDAWLDYPSLGADRWGVYVTGNLFKWTGGFKSAYINSVNPAVYTGGSANGWIFWDLKWNNGAQAFGLQVADPHSINGNQETYFVNSFPGSGSELLLWTMSGDRTSSPTLTRATIPLSTSYYSIGNNVDQSGSSTDIDGGDARVQNAIYVGRRVLTTLTNDVGNNGTQTGILTVKLNSDAKSKEWEKNLNNTNNYFFYPAVTIKNSFLNGPVGLFMSWSSASQFVSSVYKVYEDPSNNNNGAFIVYEPGVESYVVNDGNGRNRWGDYSGADYDWNCPGRMWGATEYAGFSNTWRTRIAGVMMDNSPECPLGRPAKATLITPNGPINDDTPTYTWLADADASSYTLFVIDADGEIAINSVSYTATQAGCSSGTGICSVTPTTVLAGGGVEWTWIVNGWNANYGYGSWSTSQFFTVNTPPPTATLISPSSFTNSTPTYTWNAVSTSTWYRLWVNDASGNPVRTWYTAAATGCPSGTGDCSITPPEVLSQGTATWWIQTWNDAGFGSWSNALNITVDGGIPPTATLVSPMGIISDSSPTYSWNAVVGSTWYRLWVNDPTGNVILQWYTASQVGCPSGIGICSITPTTALQNGNGAWWIQTWNSDGSGPWSSVLNFIRQ